MTFCDCKIDALRDKVKKSMSEFRFNHTAGVEKMAIRLGELYAPDMIPTLRVAALLHDITKELSVEQQVKILEDAGDHVTDLDKASYKTLHARTAVIVIQKDYPEFADETVLNAVRYHTVGRADMSLCECIIFLADYIDESRKFENCVYLRNYFWDADPKNMSDFKRVEHLMRTLVLAFDLTMSGLIKESAPISVDSVEARNSIILKLKA